MASEKSYPSTLESQSFFNLAMEHIKQSRYEKAIPLLKEALHIAPENPEYLSYLGLCLGHVGENFPMAVRLCKRALMLGPGDTILQVNLGKVYKLMGDASSAYSVFLDAWRRDKHHPAPATELSRMGIRRPRVLPFLPRSHWLNRYLGVLRTWWMRLFRKVLTFARSY